MQKKRKILLSERNRRLIGLISPRRFRRENYLLRLMLGVLFLLPWAAVLLGMLETWDTYAIGDEVNMPWWAVVLLIILPLKAVVLSRMCANRIVLGWMLRKEK